MQQRSYLQYEEVDTHTDKIIYAGKWITSLPIKSTMVKEFVKTARARWKIENETFNVLVAKYKKLSLQLICNLSPLFQNT